MMTVKHISLAGRETIYPAYSVEFRPADDRTLERLLAFTETRYVVVELHDGTAFVMNDHGKTVSRYDLGASEVALGADPTTTAQAQAA